MKTDDIKLRAGSSFSGLSKNNRRHILTITFSCLIYIGLALFLFIHNDFYFKWVEGLSLALPFTESMKFTGGLLVYLGTFLMQFFYYPIWGGIIFIVISMGIQYLTVIAFNIPRKYYPLSFIPAFMLLLSLVQLGYVWISLKSPGYFFSNALGIIVFLSCFIGFKKTRNIILQAIVLLAIIGIGYPLFGFYALLAALFSLLYTGILLYTRKNIKYLFSLLLGVISIIVIPLIYYYQIYYYLRFSHIYIAGLPYFSGEDGTSMWIPFIILFLSFILYFPFLLSKEDKKRTNALPLILSSVIFITAAIFTYSKSYKNENFEAEIKMTAAMEENNWQDAVTIAENLKGQLTRGVIVSHNLALFKLGQGGNKMFHINHNTVDYDGPRPRRLLMNMSGYIFDYYFGKINYSYRWCMENMVTFGMRVSYLKYMVKCAILNNEYELARKYNAVLSKTLFHKKWAEKYQAYIDNPQLVENDKEMEDILSLVIYENDLGGDRGLLELYIINSFTAAEARTVKQLELSLQFSLLMKDADLFWPRYLLYKTLVNHIPVHFQEAALLYSNLEMRDLSDLNIDKAIWDKYNRFRQILEHNAQRPKEGKREAVKIEFEKTFWYYYFFVDYKFMN